MDTPVQLRAKGERAVLVGHDGRTEREVDPGNLALGGHLSDELHEWARVASAVLRSESATDAAAGAVVSRRGLQLATRVAASMGVPVGYLDPLTGRIFVLDPPAVGRARPPQRPTEPTPWLSGLGVSAFIVVLVFVAMLTLATTLAQTNFLWAVGSNAVVTAGLLPSVWLIRHTPIWRWVSLGVATGMALAWLTLPFILL